MKVTDVLEGLAVAAQAIATSATDPTTKRAATGAALLIALVERVLAGRTVDEAKAILEALVADGVKPISGDELAAQAAAIVAKLKGGA